MILVVGATGTQGGHVADALLADGHAVAALTRDPDAPAARALADRGVEVRRGDLADADGLTAALEGADGVFYPSVGGDERAFGRNVADAAARAGVGFLVVSTGGNCGERPGVPHVDAKADVEDAVRDSGVPAFVVRPHTFVTNFRMQASALRQGTFPYPLPEGRELAVVDPVDIGWLAARAFADPDRYAGRTVELAAGSYDIGALADAFADALGHPVEPAPMTADEMGDRMGAPPAFVRFIDWMTSHEPPDLAPVRALGFEPTPLPEAVARVVDSWSSS
jgi:uncharacterized protein YbjT (DUF2867 family)